MDFEVKTDFNTSHVTVYHGVTEVKIPDELHFNTSHVTVYRLSDNLLSVRTAYFNTSHVTVYRNELGKAFILTGFQYISCYCLSRSFECMYNCWRISIHLMLLFINYKSQRIRLQNYFNTSHVTVYRTEGITKTGNQLFQYISCYCLSL